MEALGEDFDREEADIVSGGLIPGAPLFFLCPIGEGELAAWAADHTHPVKRMIYFVGNLLEARDHDERSDLVGQAAYRLAEAGSVNLFQQRVTENVALYIAERRPTLH